MRDIDETFECPCMLCVRRRKEKMKDKDCCNNRGVEVLTPYPKKRNKIERFFNRYNHLMEFIRTIFALTTVLLQLFILSKLI